MLFKVNEVILQRVRVSKFFVAEILRGAGEQIVSDVLQGFVAVSVNNFSVFLDADKILFGRKQTNQPVTAGRIFSGVVEDDVMNCLAGVTELPRAFHVNVIAVAREDNQAQAANENDERGHHHGHDKNNHVREN